jgi:hypothetical protein
LILVKGFKMFLLDLLLDVVNGVRGLDVEGHEVHHEDLPHSTSLDEDVHATARTLI